MGGSDAVTESEWLGCTGTRPLIKFLRGKTSDRKLRLFAVACCRRIWDLMGDRSNQAVEVAERYADGNVTDAELAASASLASATAVGAKAALAAWAAWVAWAAVAMGVERAAAAATWTASEKGEDRPQINLLRDIFGNPFRPSPPLPPAVLAWNDGTVRRLAAGIYKERQLPAGTLDNARLAILADALLDAGCDNEDLIQHCREAGSHVRGCWPLDLILSKDR